MNIGTPIVVKRVGESTTVTNGDIEKAPDSCLYNFFKQSDTPDVEITSQGMPVNKSEISKYLKTILCENLEINANLAKKKLEIPLTNETIQEL